LKSMGLSQGSWIMPTIIHNYQVGARTLYNPIDAPRELVYKANSDQIVWSRR
jgi:hypothetical protein